MTRTPPKKTLENLTTRAILAAHPYKKYEGEITLPAGWEQIATSKDLIGDTSNDFSGALYRYTQQDTAQARYALVFCGFDSAGDIIQVLDAGFSGLPGQLDDALAFTQKACETFGISTDALEFAGHSLGGYLARAVGVHWGAVQVTAFNSPGFKKDDPKKLADFFKAAAEGKTLKKPAVFSVNSKYDIISRWGYHQGRIVELETPEDHHNMKEIIAALARLEPAGIAVKNARKNEGEVSLIRQTMRDICDSVGKSEKIRGLLDKTFGRKGPKNGG